MSRMFAMLFALSLGFISMAATAQTTHRQFAPPNQNEGNNS